jgi:integrase
MGVELETVAEFLTGSPAGSDTLPWSLLRRDDLRVVQRWAGEALPPPAERRLIRELRAAIRDAPAPEDESASARHASRLRPSRRGDRAAVPISTRAARLLLQLCHDATDATASRDCAVISLLLLAGLRRQELIGLQSGDYDEADGRIEVRSRGTRRSVLLEGECRADVERWLGRRGSGQGPLFLAFASTGGPLPRGIAASTVNRILSRRGAEAGLHDLTPAALRRRFLLQLQARSRQGAGPRCRYYVSEDGQPGWALASLASV